jgi:hypothetical protein
MVISDTQARRTASLAQPIVREDVARDGPLPARRFVARTRSG